MYRSDHRHCSVSLNESTLFVFGGVSIQYVNDSYTEEQILKYARMRQSFTGFFMEFPDPSNPGYYIYKEVFVH